MTVSDMDEGIKERVRRLLDENGVRYDWLEHERVFSMDECRPIGERLGARHCKNLLLTNRQKTRFYLLLTDERPFRTAAFSRALGVSRVSFVPGEDMPALMGVAPGSASPLALINDPEGRVRLVIDRRVLSWPRVSLHPGDSTASLALDMEDMLRLCRGALGHEYDVVDMGGADE